MHNFVDAQDIDTLKLLTNARTIRCLVDAWVKSWEGKEALRLMNNITESRDILRDIKTCICEVFRLTTGPEVITNL